MDRTPEYEWQLDDLPGTLETKTRPQVRREAVRTALNVFFANKVLVLLASALGSSSLFGKISTVDFWKYVVVQNFNRWDAEWYGIIAQKGYDLKASAFFPLYPLLIRAVSAVTHKSPAVAGWVIANAAFLLMLYMAYRLLRLDYKHRDAGRIMWLIGLYPMSFYFTAIYSESLFLLFVVVALHGLRTASFGLAGAGGFFASVTRNTGVFLTVPYALECLHIVTWRDLSESLRRPLDRIRQSGWRKLWPVLVIPVPFFLYMAYLKHHLGDPFAFAHAQHLYGRSFLNPLRTLYQGYHFTVGWLLHKPYDWYYLYFLIEIFFVSLTLLVLAASLRTMRLPYWIIILYSLLIPLSAPAHDEVKDYFVSYSRYSMAVFPLYIGLYELIKKRNWLYYAMQLVFLASLLVLVYAWSHGKWIA